MKLQIKKATTSKRIGIFIQDSSKTDGDVLAALVWNAAGLKWYYWREAAGNVDATIVALATATRGTWATGGFKEKDATNLKGFYEISIPDAALATGADWVVMKLFGAANMAPITIEIQLTDFDPNSATVDVGKIDGDAEAAQDLKAAVKTVVRGTVDNTVTPTSTQFEADDITEATADHFKNRTVIFTSGALKDQFTEITAYALVAGRARFTVVQMTEAPANDDTFVIV